MKKLCDWIINSFSYVQIYAFICALFLFSLVPIGFFWIKTHSDQLKTLDGQLGALREEKILVDIFSLIQDFRMTTQKIFRDPENEIFKTQSEELIKQIDRNFELLGQINFFGYSSKLASEALLWEKVVPELIQEQWKESVKQLPNLTARQNESKLTTLLSNFNLLFDYLSNVAGIDYFNQINRYLFVQSIFLRFSTFEEDLSQLVLTAEKVLTSQSSEISRDRAQSLIDSLESNLNYFKKVFNTYVNSSLIEDQSYLQMAHLTKTFFDDAQETISLIQTKVLAQPAPTISPADFLTETQKILPLGVEAWQQLLNSMIEIFKTEYQFVFRRLLAVLLLTLFLSGTAFLLGLFLTYTGILRLSELTEATKRFTNGDLTVRISDFYEDAIGKQAQAFNHMAQRLEEMIHSLYELIDATTSLAHGKLSQRITLREDESEFDQVAISFNKMAQTFETIMGRLKQIATMLTASATEIASASKEHETTIVEQEGTTREIAVAASEISTTAKTLAATMNEVSQTAEQTSSLALKGKESLNNMESIMRNLVEASSKIASKLAVLNEKAGNITSVITTITKVADQTNLLSLNASIEAEKAGEYGRSFAVIAREIRRLADQSAIATLDIEKMVNEIMAAVSSSVMGVDEFTKEIRNGVEQVGTASEQLAFIIEQVQAFTLRFETVNQGMQTQSTGAGQIHESIAQLSKTARQTSEAIHQFHKTVEELNKAANELSILNPFQEKV